MKKYLLIANVTLLLFSLSSCTHAPQRNYIISGEHEPIASSIASE